MMELKSIEYDPVSRKLRVLNQLLLPHETVYLDVNTTKDGWACIRQMCVRGAPAIAIVAILSLCAELNECGDFNSVSDLKLWVGERLNYLKTSRPTAVNLFDLCHRCELLLNNSQHCDELKNDIFLFAERFLREDVEDNMAIGEHGYRYLKSQYPLSMITVLTHCNTGSLATAGYGTALGVARSLKSHEMLKQIFCTETRPYNQGSRLTAYELVVDKLPGATLITDSMVSFLLASRKASGDPLHAIIVGADRIAANGDTANKIGM
jgi:methylthioribose-1-phosphate isomerase